MVSKKYYKYKSKWRELWLPLLSSDRESELRKYKYEFKEITEQEYFELINQRNNEKHKYVC